MNMQIIIHSKNLDLTSPIETMVNNRLAGLGKFFKPGDELVELRVEVGRPSKHHRKGVVYYAEINLKIGKNLLRATEEHFELESAVVAAREDIESQVNKFKTKIKNSQRKPKRQ